MKTFILDSHTLLWYLAGSQELSPLAKKSIMDADNTIYVSIASLWEIGIKHSLGKLDLPKPFAALEPSLQAEGFSILPITIKDITEIIALPFHHRDPFDRILVAQAIRINCPVIGRDEAFDLYGITRHW